MREQKIMIKHHKKYSTIRVLKDNRNEKKSIEASYSSQNTKRFTFYWFLIKLQNVIINRIHSFTSLRGAFIRMGLLVCKLIACEYRRFSSSIATGGRFARRKSYERKFMVWLKENFPISTSNNPYSKGKLIN